VSWTNIHICLVRIPAATCTRARWQATRTPACTRVASEDQPWGGLDDLDVADRRFHLPLLVEQRLHSEGRPTRRLEARRRSHNPQVKPLFSIIQLAMNRSARQRAWQKTSGIPVHGSPKIMVFHGARNGGSTQYTRKHTYTHTHARARTHAHTHTYTHTSNTCTREHVQAQACSPAHRIATAQNQTYFDIR
jgi:hypothetical protein